MQKQSEIVTPLLPHQQKALERAMKQNLLLAHSTGSGKTLTSIAIANALNKPTTVLTPASLVENYKKEIAKHQVGGPMIDVYSLPTAAAQNIEIPQGNTVILDEVHALRTPGTRRYKYLTDQLHSAGRIIGLTGTPDYNNIENWGPIINLVSQRKVFPNAPNDFRRMFITETQASKKRNGPKRLPPKLKNQSVLQERLRKYVDFAETDLEKPKRIEEFIDVPMDPRQQKLYNYVEKNMPANALKILQYNLPPTRKELVNFNAFLSGVRQVSNTPQGFDTKAEPGAKIRECVRQLKLKMAENPKLRALVYSNFKDSGVNAIAHELDKDKIPYAVFDGSLTSKQKKDIVDRYNSGKLPIILGTGSASEGLDLKDTNLIQLLEPHFNSSRMEQVIGRGIRYKSHDDLPPDQRKVLVQRFRALKRPTWMHMKPNTSVDEYLYTRVKEKDDLIKNVRRLLQ